MNLCIAWKLFELLKWILIIYVFLWYFFSFVKIIYYFSFYTLKQREKKRWCLVLLCYKSIYIFFGIVYSPNIKPFVKMYKCVIFVLILCMDLELGSGRAQFYWNIQTYSMHIVKLPKMNRPLTPSSRQTNWCPRHPLSPLGKKILEIYVSYWWPRLKI